VEEFVKNDYDEFSARGSVAEDYLKRRVDLHFHAAGTIQRDTLIAGNYCLSLRKRECAAPSKRHLTRAVRHLRTSTDCREEGDEQSPMLVDVIQLVEKPERMRRRISSVVRLQSLDDCLRTWGKISYATRALLLETCKVFEDWECSDYRFRVRQRSLHVFDGKRMNQVIQRRPEIVETISNKGKNNRWRRSAHLSVDDIISTFRVEFVGDEIRTTFSPTAKFYPQFFQMLIRAI